MKRRRILPVLAMICVVGPLFPRPCPAVALPAPPTPGEILVCDASGGLGLAVFNPQTGALRSLSAGGAVNSPVGLALESPTSAIVTNLSSKSVVRVDLNSGAQSVISTGGFIDHPDGVTVGPDGTIYVAELESRNIVAVNPTTGVQHVVTTGNLLSRPVFMLPYGADSLLVSSDAIGRIVWVRISNGAQTIAASGGGLSRPEGMAFDTNGRLIVCDLGTRQVLSIDLSNGVQTIVASGLVDTPLGLVLDGLGSAIVGNFNLVPNAFTKVNLATGAKQGYTTSPLSAFGMARYGTPGAPPEAPAELIASDDQADGVHLSWRSVADATVYRVFRDSAAVAVVGAPDTTYLDTPAVGTFGYCVYALNVGGSSSPACDLGTRRDFRRDPTFQFVKDVPNDQGGKVALAWLPSELDALPQDPIVGYRVWRRLPVQDALRHSGLEPADVRGRARAIGQAQAVTYWEALGTYPAAAVEGYGAVVATTQDSVPAGNPYTAFFVSALTANASVFYDSAIDSGYSVDNLAPQAPGGLHGTMSNGGVVTLHWLPSPAPDFGTFRVYRGQEADFPLDGAHLLAAIADTVFADPGVSESYYKVTALDVHGNESPPAGLGPTDVPTATLVSRIDAFREGDAVRVHVEISTGAAGATAILYRATTTDFADAVTVPDSPLGSVEGDFDLWDRAPLAAGAPAWYWAQLVNHAGVVVIAGPVAPAAGAVPAVSLLARLEPNPTTQGTTVRFRVGTDATHGGTAMVRLAVFDVRGHALRSLVAEPRAAAAYEATWDGRDDSGRSLAAGVYFVHLAIGPRTFVQKLVRAR